MYSWYTYVIVLLNRPDSSVYTFQRDDSQNETVQS